MANAILLIATLLIVVICLALLVVEVYSYVRYRVLAMQTIEAFDEAFLAEGVQDEW